MMKKIFLVLSLMLVAALVILPGRLSSWASTGQERDSRLQSEDDLPERDEFHQTYELAPGARVEIRGMNGKVQIETYNGSTAEVHIIRSARDKADLEFRKIAVEQTPNSLVVRSVKDRENEGNWGRNREVRQRVIMKIPRRVEFVASGINGKADVGEIDGPVDLGGINGSVSVSQAKGYSRIHGINGRVTITIAQLGERGIEVSGVNGGVELKFVDDLNADLSVSGVNGNVSADVPNVVVQGKMERSNFRARIGAGGSPINVSGVNGRVRITRAGSAG